MFLQTYLVVCLGVGITQYRLPSLLLLKAFLSDFAVECKETFGQRNCKTVNMSRITDRQLSTLLMSDAPA